MDGSRFDALTKSLIVPGTRRRLIGGIVAGVLGLASIERGVARTCSAGGIICREHANCCSGECGPKDRTGRRRCAAAFCQVPLESIETQCLCAHAATPSGYGCVVNSMATECSPEDPSACPEGQICAATPCFDNIWMCAPICPSSTCTCGSVPEVCEPLSGFKQCGTYEIIGVRVNSSSTRTGRSPRS